jgi:hypothetical protein
MQSFDSENGHMIAEADDKVSIIAAHSTRLLPDSVKLDKPYAWAVSMVDHGKWAVLGPQQTGTDSYIICLSGSNREQSQSWRGGEAV